MDLAHQLVVVSAIINIAGTYAYLRDTLKGKTKPNRVSFGMWSLAPLIGTAAALYSGADFWVTSRVFLAGFLPLIVLIASFVNPLSYWKLTFFDFACGVCSMLAIMVWAMVDSPRTAILLVAIGDGLASLPTLRKAWIKPETETAITYVAFFVSSLLVFPAIPEWNIENAAFPIFLLIQNSFLMLVVYRKRVFKSSNFL